MSSVALFKNSILAQQRATAIEDPLKLFRCRSWVQRRMIELCGDTEVYWRAGNKGGKTTGGAALGVALSRGLEELDGIPLPALRCPNVGWVIIQSYKQSVDSVLAAYRQMIGDWPHHEAKIAGAHGYVGVLYVKPERSRSTKFQDWSRIMFFPDAGVAPVGGTIDWAHADEPPTENMWREVRFRWRAGAPFIRFITATPLHRRDWEWLRADFAGCRGEARGGKIELQSSIYDNEALSKDDIKRAEEDAAGDPYKMARLMGDYVDTSGACPFPSEILTRWRARCTDPARERIVVLAERDDKGGRTIAERVVELEVWNAPDERDVYLVVADPSSGVRSEAHDPAGLQVWSRRRRALVCRFNGYLDPYGLGTLASRLSRSYNAAQIDVENNSGWANPFLRAVFEERKLVPGVGHVLSEQHVDRFGRVEDRLGWRTTAESRAELIAALQKAMANDDCGIYSKEVVDCLSDCVMDTKDKILAGPGGHDEDLILCGRALHLIQTRPARDSRPYQLPERDHTGDWMKAQFGKDLRVSKRRPASPQLRWLGPGTG